MTDGVRWIYRANAREELDAALPRLRDRLGAPLPVARARRHRSFHEVASAQGGLFVKRLLYERLDLSLWLRVVLSRVRGVREFRNAVRAHARGAPVPEPLAFGVATRPQRGYESLLVYRRLPEGSRTLAELKLESLPDDQRAGILAALAGLTADLHERGVYHLDLTPMNVVRTGGSDARAGAARRRSRDDPARQAAPARAGGALARAHRRTLRVGLGRGARALPRRLPGAERCAVTPPRLRAHVHLGAAGAPGARARRLSAPDRRRRLRADRRRRRLGPRDRAPWCAASRERAPFPVQHVWHAREGHRRTTILNLAVTRTSAEQLLYTDGDCVPAADLVAVHRRELEPGTLLIGGYVRVRPEIGDAADEDWVLRGEHERLLGPRERLALWRRHAKNVWQIRTRRRRRPHNLGLNMSLARADLLRVNGYDENYRGWGNEDGDLRERLKRVGVWPKSIWTKALVFHLDHPVDPTRKDRARNLAYSRRQDIPVVAARGIEKREGD